ncbi:MAG: YARHG domain-containing protein [Peptostreptococcaceae bacterium]|nr:YARHG domain-containing protein [Peptostreptococcaceae bacterium]
MERNPLFTKEKADFIFKRVQKYYDQQAYQQALDEFEQNRELLGSVLNIGSQMSLNKIILKSVVNLMYDAFEVDGDLSKFSSLFAQHKTLIELHTERKTYELLHKYKLERESNPNFKSKSEYNNKTVPYDNEVFPDEGVLQLSIKSSTDKTESAKDIEQDFLDSIEKPSFQFGQLTEEELETPTEVIRSNVNAKAIYEDFFKSIRPPELPHHSADPDADIEQIRFDAPALAEPKKKKTSKKAAIDLEKTQVFEQLSLSEEQLTPPKRSSKTKEKEVVIEPISIKGTILDKNHVPGKQDPATKALREKILDLESKLNDDKTASKKEAVQKKETAVKKEPAPEPTPTCVKERREVMENGQKRTETIHRSGGKITEIVIDGYSLSENKKAASQKKKKPKEQPQQENRSKNKEPQRSAAKKGAAATHKKSKHHTKKENNPFVLLVLICILALIVFGGYKLLTKNNEPNQTPNVSGTAEPNANTDPNDSSEPSDNSGETNDSSGTEPQEPVTEPTDEASSYLLPSHERELTDADLEGMSKAELRYAINELFARHGWNFGGSGQMFDYFSKKNWYKPDASMTSSANAENKFSAIERANLRFLTTKYKSM